ncbi:MAG: hypothetical protein AB9866_24095 [Syntrophobacteraceae bacterium]
MPPNVRELIAELERSGFVNRRGKGSHERLCQIVEEAIELYHKEDKPLPPATSGLDFANRMQQVS